MHPGNRRHHLQHDNLRDMVTIEAIDCDKFKSGQLKHASLTLRGKLVFATIIIHPPNTSENPQPNEWNITMAIPVLGGGLYRQDLLSFVLDNRDAEIYYREELVCLAMWECCCDHYKEIADSTRYLEALSL
jgi:hypothetical protein